MKYFNKLSKDYDFLYQANITTFQENLNSIGGSDKYFVDGYPNLGIRPHQSCDLLFYGQAINGGASGFDLDTEINQSFLENSIYFSNRYFELLNHTPLDWVNVRYSKSVFEYYCQLNNEVQSFYNTNSNYWSYKSFFWNVVYKVPCDYYGIDRNDRTWAEKVVCSNLYKISEDGKNPIDKYKQFQFDTSVKLLKQEILELKPKYCILLTNLDWWEPFQKELQTKPRIFNKSLNLISSFEELLIGNISTKMLITTRPFSGSGNGHVGQIMKLINE